MSITSNEVNTPTEPQTADAIKSRILIVDDDQHMQKLITYNLQTSGYEVEFCQQGEDA